MKRIYFIGILVSYLCCGAYGQRSHNKIVYPLKKILRNIDTLIVAGTPNNNRNIDHDTVLRSGIERLAGLVFLNKKIRIEEYGVTPDGAISLFSKGKRIALISCWKINSNTYGVNISINEKFIYYGLTIQEKLLDESIKKKP